MHKGITRVLTFLAVLLLTTAVFAGEAEPYIETGFGITGGAKGPYSGEWAEANIGIEGTMRIGGDIHPNLAIYGVMNISGTDAPWYGSEYPGLRGQAGIGIGVAWRKQFFTLHCDILGIADIGQGDYANDGYMDLRFGGKVIIEPEFMIAPAREWFGFSISVPLAASFTSDTWGFTGGIAFSFSLGDHLEGY